MNLTRAVLFMYHLAAKGVPDLQSTRALVVFSFAFVCMVASSAPDAAAQDPPDPAGDHLEGMPSAGGADASIDEEAPDMLQKGAWKYSIPIEVPPAPRDLKPHLAFVASHTQRDGLLGRGWSLGGFSAIERHGTNGGVPEMRDTDSFWLDGLLLIKVGSRLVTGSPADPIAREDPSAAGSRTVDLYRLEKDDNRVFEFDAVAQSWTAFRDGWTWRWGEYERAKDTQDQRLGAGATERWQETAPRPADCDPRRPRERAGPDRPVPPGGLLGDLLEKKGVTWRVSQIQDPFGNAIGFSYTDGCACGGAIRGAAGEALPCPHLPREIAFGTSVVAFAYEQRPDSMVSARDGVPRRHGRRLTGVTTSVADGKTQRQFSRYRVHYADNSPSIVQRIDQVAADGAVRQLLTTSVDQGPTRFRGPFVLGGFERLNDLDAARPIKVNFNGDQYPDLVVISPAPLGDSYTVVGYRNLGDHFEYDAAMTAMLEDAFQHVTESHAYQFADVDGDGRTELMVPGGRSFAWDPVRERYELSTSRISSLYLPEAQLVDIDGDGLPDYVDRGLNWVRNSGVAPFFDGQAQLLDLPLGNYNNPEAAPVRELEDQCSTTDLKFLWDEAIVVRWNARTSVRHGLPTYGDYERYWAGQSRFADLNGDGVADLAYSFETCWGVDGWSNVFEPRGNIYSRIFWGIGDGSFRNSGLSAGPPFIERNSPAEVGNPPAPAADEVSEGYYLFNDWKSWMTADLDGDGVAEIVHRPDGQAGLVATTFDNAERGWTFSAGASSAIALPAGVKALSTYATAGERPHPCWCEYLQTSLIGDWNADGFADILTMERPAAYSAERTYTVKVYPSEREAPRYATTGFVNQWGGETALTFASSAEVGANPDLPFPMVVVDSVLDHRGESTFSYNGGRVELGRFLGFAEVEGRYENGLHFEAQFSLAPYNRGDLVSRTERRADGTVERFTYNRYYRVAEQSVSFDVVPPYFNPATRTCEFEVGRPVLRGGVARSLEPTVPSVSEEELIEECLDFEAAGPLVVAGIRHDLDSLVYGWATGPVTTLRTGRVGELLRPSPRRPTERSVAQASAKTRPAPDWLSKRTAPVVPLDTFAPVSKTTSDRFAAFGLISVEQPALTRFPSGVERVAPRRMFVRDQTFNADQRVAQMKDYKHSATRGDELTIDFDYASYVAGRVHGAELVGYRVSGPNGEQLRRITLADHAAFGAPATVIEIGRSGARRSTTYAYNAQGLVERTTKQVNASGRRVTDEIAYNGCGLPQTVVDTGGRKLAVRYDGACRRSLVSFEGGVERYAYDGFGRLVRTAKQNGVSPVQVSLTRYDDAAASFGKPRKVSVRGDLAEFVYADEWGRPLAEKRCRLDDPASAGTAGTLADIACDEVEAIWKLKLWARDGSPRFRSGSFKRGEIPTFEWTYYDERRRLVRRVLPNHAYPRPERVAGFDLNGTPGTVEFVTRYDVGVTSTTEPGGRTCAEYFGTLSKRRECAGLSRGSMRFDALGNIVSTTTFEGINTTFEYDDFYRVKSETTQTSLNTCDGTLTNPTVRYQYNELDQLLAKILPNDAAYRWTRDDLGRLTSATVETKAEPQKLVLNRWEYVDGSPTGTESAPAGRSLVEIDASGNRSTRYLDGFGATYATETPDGRIATMHRDAEGRVTHARDIDGVETQFVFDSFGRVVQEFVVLPESSSGYCTADNVGADGLCRIGVENTYDGAGRLTGSIDADGVSRAYSYTVAGDLALEKQGRWLMSAYRYDDRGNPELVWEDGAVTSFTYDDLDRIIRECRGAHGGRCGQSLGYTYTDADRIQTVTVGAASTTSYQYDALGRVVGLTNPDGTTRTMRYGAVTPMCSLTDEDGITTSWAHDPLGRMSEARLPGRSEPRRYDYAFRADGRAFGLEVGLAEVAVTESDGGVWTTWYDFAHRPVEQQRPDGSTLHYAYEGARLRNVMLLDPTRRPLEVIAFGYDDLGRRAWEWGPVSPETYEVRGGMPSEGDYVQRVAYTRAGRLQREDGPVDPGTRAPLSSSLYTYGADGLLAKADQIGVTSWRYAYDQARRFPRVVEVAAGVKAANLRRTRYAYDPSGLYLQRTSTTGPRSGGTSDAQQILATVFEDFDDFGTPRSIETVDATETPRILSGYDLTTDINGRVAKVAVALEGVPLGLATFDYFPNGQVDRALADWAGGLDYDRLPDGRISTVRGLDKLGNQAGTIVRFSAWNAIGKPVAADLADGATVTFDYDTMGRVVEQRISSPGSPQRRLVNTYDARGLLRSERVAADDKTYENLFDYTAEGWLEREQRLVGGTAVSGFDYTYDAAGNRLERRHSDGLVDRFRYGAAVAGGSTGSVLLAVEQEDGWADLEWDQYGGLVRDHRGFRLERDARGKVDKLWDASGYLVTSFLRDHAGRPVKMSSDRGARTHFWGHPTSTMFPFASVDEQGVASINAAFEQFLLGRVVGQRPEAMVTDVRGNLVLAGKQILDLADAYGAGVARPSNGFGFVFAGQEMLEQAPYFSAQQRLYDPDLGLFESIDPAGQPGGRHLFRYAGNNPASRIDPWGTQDTDVPELGGGDEGAAEVAETSSGSEDAKVIRLPEGVVETHGWQLEANDIVNVQTGERYPVDNIDTGTMGTTSGEEVTATTVWFHVEGAGEFVTFFGDVPPGAETEEKTGGLPSDGQSSVLGDESNGAVGPLETSDMAGNDGGSDTDPNPGSESAAGGAGESSAPERLLHNYVGTRERLDELLSDGYQIDFDTGLLETPGGAVVIQGWNDALNPLPHKVAINMAADTIDDVLNLGLPGQALQAAGIWGGAGTPANDLIKDLGFGYTPSEAPREFIAEMSMSLVVGAVSAPASAAATLRAEAVLARGCSGPLRHLPTAMRVISGVTCFVGETEVATAEGLSRIDEIEPGDLVPCQDDVSHQTRLCAVSRVYKTENRDILDLTVAGPGGREEVIGVTGNHRLWAGDEGWTEAAELTVGDHLVDQKGKPVSVVAIEQRNAPATTYNLEVDGFHTYFVGQTGVWVHNGGPSTCPATTKKALNLREAARLLGRPVTGWDKVTVGELRDLAGTGVISRTNLTKTLRGSSTKARREIIRLFQDVLQQAGVKDGTLARVGDQMVGVSTAAARSGQDWHVGHFGEAFATMVDQVDGSMSVRDFKSGHWLSGLLESAPLNVQKGAATTALDMTH